MTTSEQLAIRFRDVILKGTWIANTNFKDQIEDIDWTAATKKVASLNTISILTQHVNYYIKGIINVYINGKLEIKDKYSFDFPPVTSETEWTTIKNNFWSNAEKLANLIEQMNDEQLEEDFVDNKYGTYLRNIDGLIEHCYYHLGQVVLIKKMLTI